MRMTRTASTFLLLSLYFVAGCGAGGASDGSSASYDDAPSDPANYRVVAVTSLADSGPGSLRACADRPFKRVCVFETSGRIALRTPIVVEHPDLVVAGATAPSPGILVTNSGLKIRAGNVLVEHLAIRPGDEAEGAEPSERDGVVVEGGLASSVRLRNLSVSWAVDENVSTSGPVRDVSVERCIISEALYDSIHPDGPHSMGALVGEGARRVSFVGNLFAANYDRNVRWKFDTSGEMVGNLIYGWGGKTPWNTTNLSDLEGGGGAVTLDVVSNVYVPGPEGLRSAFAVFAEEPPSGTRVFLADNRAPRETNLPESLLASSPVVGATAVPYGSEETPEKVFAEAGSRPWERNPVDKAVISGVRSETLRIRDGVGSFPEVAEHSRPLPLSGMELAPEEVPAALAAVPR